MNNFFSALRQKLERKPDRHFDQRFWRTFNEEFKAKTSLEWKPRFSIYVSGTALAGLVALFMFFNQEALLSGRTEEMAQAHEIIENEAMYDNLDLLLTTNEVADDEAGDEWDVLMEDSG